MHPSNEPRFPPFGGRVAHCESRGQRVTHAFIVTLAVLGVIGQVLAVLLLLVGVLALVGVRGPLALLRSAVWGYELWLAFVVAAIATAGSLFFSEIAHFVPCELCWYQRICMYPLSLITLFAALLDDHRIARYLLPFPVDRRRRLDLSPARRERCRSSRPRPACCRRPEAARRSGSTSSVT